MTIPSHLVMPWRTFQEARLEADHGGTGRELNV